MESFIKVTHASSQTGVKIYEAKKHTETNFLSQASNRSYAEHLYKLSRGASVNLRNNFSVNLKDYISS